MLRRTPTSTRPDTLVPSPALFGSRGGCSGQAQSGSALHARLSTGTAGRGAERDAGPAGRVPQSAGDLSMKQAAAPSSQSVRPRLGFLGVGCIGRNRMEAIAARDIARKRVVSGKSV